MEPLQEQFALEQEDLEDDTIKTELFVVWESSCRNFIDDVQFSCYKAMDNLRLHVFLRRDTPEDAMPPEKEWIQKHFTMTTCPYASDTSIVSYLTELTRSTLENLQNGESLNFYLVSDRERKYEELIAILKARSPKLNVCEINGRDQTILQVLSNVCQWCKIVFLNREETEEHLALLHNYFCFCSDKRFASESELEKHRASQTQCHLCGDKLCSQEKRILHLKEIHFIESRITPDPCSNFENSLKCQFCSEKIFSSTEQRNIHMKNCHKKCNCSCGEYFRNRDDYLEHFYTVYPIACFENRKCPHRFQTVLHQALHHKQDHFALQPFYCIPCHVKLVEEGTKSKACFKDEQGLRIHGMSMGHNLNEMFLPEVRAISDQVHSNGRSKRVPSRTCSAINYC